MTTTRYPEYKDSGIDWIGAMPASWGRVPFFAAARERRQKNLGMREDNLLSLSYGRVVRKDMAANDGLLPESFETYQIVHPSDVVFRLTDLQNDKRSLRSAIVTERGIITSAYLAVSPIQHVPAYFAYLMRSYDLQKVFYSMGGGLRQSMKFEDMKHLPLLLPAPEEQRQIADYLDAQTAKIDGLIGKQERLIEMLAERRQAVISHAVTKGLDPHAPMRDSGVEWLDGAMIPSTWQTRKIRSIARLRSGDTITAESIEETGAYPVFGGGGFRGFTEHFNTEGTFALIGRQGALCGNVKVASGRFFASEHAIVAYPRHSLDITWWASVLATMNLGQYSQSAAQPGLSVEVIEQKRLPMPPIEVQIAIGQHIDRETFQLDALSAKAREMIDVLKERRQALISAAVTGKIDVRELG